MTLAPIMYLPHGGGPMPLLHDPVKLPVSQFMGAVSAAAARPKAIVVVSAHWEEEQVSILIPTGMRPPYTGEDSPMAQAMKVKNGQRPERSPDQVLAGTISELLSSAGIAHRKVSEQRFDHAVFIPLKILFPDDDIPCVQISLVKGLDPAQHIEIGKALCRLRSDNVLIIGSGMSFKNMQAVQHPHGQAAAASFNQWLVDTCCSAELTLRQRERRLCDWTLAPYARFCHPSEEHLLPLHVCVGMTSASAMPAKLVFNDTAMGAKVSGVLWQ